MENQANDEMQDVVKENPVPKKKEIKFINWMRSVAIYLVIFVHVLVGIYRTVDFHEDTEYQYNLIIRIFLQFGMPIFFYFSGRAAACGFNPNKKEKRVNKWILPLIWTWKKTLRLFIPLVFGTLLIVIPTAYIGREYRP